MQGLIHLLFKSIWCVLCVGWCQLELWVCLCGSLFISKCCRLVSLRPCTFSSTVSPHLAVVRRGGAGVIYRTRVCLSATFSFLSFLFLKSLSLCAIHFFCFPVCLFLKPTFKDLSLPYYPWGNPCCQPQGCSFALSAQGKIFRWTFILQRNWIKMTVEVNNW